jgi:hypothetical protein
MAGLAVRQFGFMIWLVLVCWLALYACSYVMERYVQ